MVKHENVKILLVQLRIDPIMQAQEHRAICRSGKVSSSQITAINGLEQTIEVSDLKKHHVLIVGGTGDYSIFEPIKVTHSLSKVLQHAKDTNYPVLGSCWGGQLLAQVLGGKVETALARAELGSYMIRPTDAAKTDPLFYDAPDKFWAQIGHHESVTALPKNAINLLSSNRCTVQAFTWPGSALYGLQLHPDLSKDELVERVTHYRANYAAEQAAFDTFLATLKDSPYTDDLIAKFIDRIALPRWNKA